MTETLAEKVAAVRRADTRADATAESAAAKFSECQRRERTREENRLLWAEHYYRMAANHGELAESYRARAEAIEGQAI